MHVPFWHVRGSASPTTAPTIHFWPRTPLAPFSPHDAVRSVFPTTHGGEEGGSEVCAAKGEDRDAPTPQSGYKHPWVVRIKTVSFGGRTSRYSTVGGHGKWYGMLLHSLTHSTHPTPPPPPPLLRRHACLLSPPPILLMGAVVYAKAEGK